MAGQVQTWVKLLARALCALTVVLCAPRAVGQIPCSYEVAHIIQGPPCGIFGYPPTTGTAISPNGRYVVGYYDPCLSGFFRAFLYDTQTSQFTTLPLPPGFNSQYAADVNDNLVIVGSGEKNIVGQRGWVRDAKELYTIIEPLPGGTNSYANAVNAYNVVCGTRYSTGNTRRAFRWSEADGITDIGLVEGYSTEGSDINDHGDMTLSTGVAGEGYYGYLWENGRVTNLGPIPGGFASHPSAINARQQIIASVVVQFVPEFVVRAGVYDHGHWIELPPLPGQAISAPIGITDGGLVTGASKITSESQLWRAVVWIDGEPVDLNSITSPPGSIYLQFGGPVGGNGFMVANAIGNGGNPTCTLLSPMGSNSGDTDCNGLVDIDDFLNLINSWGACLGCSADMNADQTINIDDLLILINHWTASK
jgi:uncharacterized membrane protein